MERVCSLPHGFDLATSPSLFPQKVKNHILELSGLSRAEPGLGCSLSGLHVHGGASLLNKQTSVGCEHPRGLRPTAPGICAQAESAFPTLGAWRGPGRDSCLGHIFSSEPSGWFWLCNYSSPSSLQTWPCAPWAQDSGIWSEVAFPPGFGVSMEHLPRAGDHRDIMDTTGQGTLLPGCCFP